MSKLPSAIAAESASSGIPVRGLPDQVRRPHRAKVSKQHTESPSGRVWLARRTPPSGGASANRSTPSLAHTFQQRPHAYVIRPPAASSTTRRRRWPTGTCATELPSLNNVKDYADLTEHEGLEIVL